MNLRQLHYFVRIADSGSFSSAANELHVAQSALSRHMKELEIELGGVLFDRGRHGVVLSDSGRLLYERARFILVQLEATRNEVMAHNQELVGAVSVMMPSTIGQLLFAPLLRSFLAQFPRVRLKLSEGLWTVPCMACRMANSIWPS
jgi:LysR family nitrogen assimilation transcriptional regulator